MLRPAWDRASSMDARLPREVGQIEKEMASSEKLLDWLRAEIERQTGGAWKSRSLYLEERDIGEAGAVFLAETLRGNTTVEELTLFKCGIGPVGARALAESLSGHNDFLKRMCLHDNEGIGDYGAQALAQMLKKNTTLEGLNLGGCGVGSRGARALSDALRENFTLKSLEIYSNSINDDGAEAFAEGLRWNESLECLDLTAAELTDAGALSLLAALHDNNFTLTQLDLDYNNIQSYDKIEDSKNDLLKENGKEVKPALAEQRARCLLFCCLKLAPTAHESAVPSIGAVPVPVMQYAVEHAGKLHVAKRCEHSTAVAGQFSSANRNLRHAQAAQVQSNAQLLQQITQLQQQIAQLQQQNVQLTSRITELEASLASHASTRSSGDEDGEPANKRAKTA